MMPIMSAKDIMNLQLNYLSIVKLVLSSFASLTLTLINLGHPDLIDILGQYTSPSPSLQQNIISKYHFQLDEQFSAFDIKNDGTGDEISNPPDLPGQQIKFERISVEHGLSQSSISSILQDSKGFLWFGTEDGLNKFDGYEFTVFRHDPDDLSSLSDNSVLSIYEDVDGVLWVGTYGRGLNRFDRNQENFIRYQHNPSDPKSLVNNSVSAIANDSQGTLWVGTWDGLDRYDFETDQFIHYLHDPDDPGSLSNNLVMDIMLDHDGNLWIGTFGGGLNRYEPSTDTFTHYKYDFININRLSSNYISSLNQDQNGNLWVGTADGGLNKLDKETEKFYQFKVDTESSNSLSKNSINAVAVDATGNIWIGTNGSGIDILNPESGQFRNMANDKSDPFSLSQDIVTDVFMDRSGNLWIGTFGGGINRFDPTTARFNHFRHIPSIPQSLSANSVMSIAEDEDGGLWVGTLGGGVDFYDLEEGSMTHYKNDQDDATSLPNDRILYVYPDSVGSIWIGTLEAGLIQLDRDSGNFVQFVHNPDDPDSLGFNSVSVIYEDREGFLWIGTSGGGLDRYDRRSGKFSHYNHDPDDSTSLSNNRIWSIMQDRTGRLWIGTGGGGISILDQNSGNFIRLTHDPQDSSSLGDTDIFSIYEDSRGSIWLGTYGSGLDKYDPSTGEFEHFRTSDGLPNNVVYGILEDDEGYLWLSTNYGLSKFDPGSETFTNFDISDGLQSNEFNVGAYLKDKNGLLYFGGINGLTSFQPEKIQESTYLPPIVLTELLQDGEKINSGKPVEELEDVVLNWSNNNLEFEFVALNYSFPEKNQYAYMLEGFDDDWNMIGTSRTGRYTNLPAGSYTLRMKATNSDGVWNEEGAFLNIRVVPPFWETWWFIGLATLVVIAGVVTGYTIRIRSIESRSQELEEQVRLRTEEIEQRRFELEALYQADEVIDQNLTQDSRLRALVDVSVDILKADKSAIFIRDEGQEEFSIKASRGFGQDTTRELTFIKNVWVAGDEKQSGGVQIVEDLLNEKTLATKYSDGVEALISEGVRSIMFLPIKIGNEVFGIIGLYFTEPNAIGEEQRRVFMALTQHSALSIQNAQLFEQLRDLAITEERSRLARDLHDSAKQKAFAALAQLGAANGMLERNPGASKDHLLEAEDLVYEVLQELIILIQEMYPVTLQEIGLASSVREYVFDWEKQCEIDVDVKIINEKRLSLEIEQTLYRVVQESLANIARHSQAKMVIISIAYNTDSVELKIIDDGIGFDLSQQPSGFGLRSIRERVELIDGELSIESGFGKGTHIIVNAPTNMKF
jgi:ligand-binding sensor domain-containing protein/signal transduction histidine kinase